MLSMSVDEISQMLINRVKSAMHSKIKMPEPRKDVNLSGLISPANSKKAFNTPDAVKPMDVRISGPSGKKSVSALPPAGLRPS
jgi:hypothetical protein